MKLIGVACVKNEADIIEAFVRHNLFYLDQLILIDHGSTDETPDILNSLQQEGLALKVTRDNSLGKLQGEKMTLLARQAAEAGADWVFLLDGDEFLKPSNAKELIPHHFSHAVFKVSWHTYCVHAEDDTSDLNPVTRIQHRLQKEAKEDGTLFERTPYLKSIINKEVALHPELQILQGNHRVLIGGVEVDHCFSDTFYLAHYSLRSPGQYAAKISIGLLQHVARSSLSEPSDTFYLKHWNQAEMDFEGFARNFNQIIPSYLELVNHPADNKLDPLVYCGGNLLYTRKCSDISRLNSNLFRYAESLAQRLKEYSYTDFKTDTFNITLTLKESTESNNVLSSSSATFESNQPQNIALNLKISQSQNPLFLTLSAPIALVEILAIYLRRADGSCVKLDVNHLKQFLKAETTIHPIWDINNFIFIKGPSPSELRLNFQMVPEKGPWQEIELNLRFDTHPATLSLRYFAEDPFHDEKQLATIVKKYEAKISQLVTVRGWLNHQWNWLKSLYFSPK